MHNAYAYYAAFIYSIILFYHYYHIIIKRVVAWTFPTHAVDVSAYSVASRVWEKSGSNLGAFGGTSRTHLPDIDNRQPRLATLVWSPDPLMGRRECKLVDEKQAGAPPPLHTYIMYRRRAWDVFTGTLEALTRLPEM